MNQFRLRLGPKAMEDVDAIISWIASRSLSGARAWADAFDVAIASIVLAPLSFPRSSEASRLRRDLRDALFKTKFGRTYRVVFLTEGNDIEVLRIRGAGQPNLRKQDL